MLGVSGQDQAIVSHCEAKVLEATFLEAFFLTTPPISIFECLISAFRVQQ